MSIRRREPLCLQSLASIALEHLIRKCNDRTRDPGCPEMSALSEDQLKRATEILAYVEQIPAAAVTDILERVINYNGDSGQRKASPMDVWVLVHPSAKRVHYPRARSNTALGGSACCNKRAPLPNVHKALLETLHRCKHMEALNISGLDDHATTSDYNDFKHSDDCREHYLYVLEDSVYRFAKLTHLNLGTLATNSILKAVSETCAELRELRICGGGHMSKVGDLGLRYLAGLIPTVGQRVRKLVHLPEDSEHAITTTGRIGCFKLRLLTLLDVEKVSLHTLTLLLIHLPELRVLDHNQLHEALKLMHKTGMEDNLLHLKLNGYNGRGPSQCLPDVLDVIRNLCPRMENLHLCTTYDDTVIALAKFRDIKTLSIFRVASVKDFDVPFMAFGGTLVKLELTNCTNFQSGTALHIRKYCHQLKSLVLEIDSTEANSNSGLSEAMMEDNNGEVNNIWTLEHQVQDLQSRLSTLQITMLDVMSKYGPMEKLEHLQLRNLSMGSLLIILPFAPNLKTLSLKYNVTRGGAAASDDTSAPNLTDELFQKIFQRNAFNDLEHLTIWCKTLSIGTAQWFVHNCRYLVTLKNLSFWNINDDEAVALWQEGRARLPRPIEIDF